MAHHKHKSSQKIRSFSLQKLHIFGKRLRYLQNIRNFQQNILLILKDLFERVGWVVPEDWADGFPPSQLRLLDVPDLG